jgi:hypothetical protein
VVFGELVGGVGVEPGPPAVGGIAPPQATLSAQRTTDDAALSVLPERATLQV